MAEPEAQGFQAGIGLVNAGVNLATQAPALASGIGVVTAVASIIAGYFGAQARRHMLEDLQEKAKNATRAGMASAPIVGQLVSKALAGPLTPDDIHTLVGNIDNLYSAVGARGAYVVYGKSLGDEGQHPEIQEQIIAHASPEFVDFTGRSWRALQPTAAFDPAQHGVGLNQRIIPNHRSSWEDYHPVGSDWEAWTARYPSTTVNAPHGPNPLAPMNAYQGIKPTPDQLRGMLLPDAISAVQADPTAYGLPKGANWYSPLTFPGKTIVGGDGGYWTTDKPPGPEPERWKYMGPGTVPTQEWKDWYGLRETPPAKYALEGDGTATPPTDTPPTDTPSASGAISGPSAPGPAIPGNGVTGSIAPSSASLLSPIARMIGLLKTDIPEAPALEPFQAQGLARLWRP